MKDTNSLLFWFAVLVAVITSLILSFVVQARDTFEANETELHSFEYHSEVLLTVTKPLYRIGEILKLNGSEQYVVPVDYHWQSNHWVYSCAPVKVGTK